MNCYVCGQSGARHVEFFSLFNLIKTATLYGIKIDGSQTTIQI